MSDDFVRDELNQARFDQFKQVSADLLKHLSGRMRDVNSRYIPIISYERSLETNITNRLDTLISLAQSMDEDWLVTLKIDESSYFDFVIREQPTKFFDLFKKLSPEQASKLIADNNLLTTSIDYNQPHIALAIIEKSSIEKLKNNGSGKSDLRRIEESGFDDSDKKKLIDAYEAQLNPPSLPVIFAPITHAASPASPLAYPEMPDVRTQIAAALATGRPSALSLIGNEISAYSGALTSAVLKATLEGFTASEKAKEIMSKQLDAVRNFQRAVSHFASNPNALVKPNALQRVGVRLNMAPGAHDLNSDGFKGAQRAIDNMLTTSNRNLIGLETLTEIFPKAQADIIAARDAFNDAVNELETITDPTPDQRLQLNLLGSGQETLRKTEVSLAVLAASGDMLKLVEVENIRNARDLLSLLDISQVSAVLAIANGRQHASKESKMATESLIGDNLTALRDQFQQLEAGLEREITLPAVAPNNVIALPTREAV